MSATPPGQFLGTVRHRQASPDWVVTDLRHPHPNRFATHEHRWACLTILLGGEYTEHAHGSWRERSVNTLVVRPARAPHADRIGARGAWFLTVELSPELIPRRVEGGARLGDWAVARNPSLLAIGWRLDAELRRGAEADPLVLDGYVAALVDELSPEAVRTREPPVWLGRALAMLHDAPRERIPLDRLARECGVHPAHLTRAFRRHMGQTVGTYARALRLAEAMRRLAHPGATPAGAACEAGFHDQSHLSRTLRAVTGLTPGRYRRSFRYWRGESPRTSG